MRRPVASRTTAPGTAAPLLSPTVRVRVACAQAAVAARASAPEIIFHRKYRIAFGRRPGPQVLQQFFHGQPQCDDYRVGCDLIERRHDESAIVHARMRKIEAGLMNLLVSQQQQVEVEGSRAIADGARAIAS